jgi:hypothetical protein
MQVDTDKAPADHRRLTGGTVMHCPDRDVGIDTDGTPQQRDTLQTDPLTVARRVPGRGEHGARVGGQLHPVVQGIEAVTEPRRPIPL